MSLYTRSVLSFINNGRQRTQKKEALELIDRLKKDKAKYEKKIDRYSKISTTASSVSLIAAGTATALGTSSLAGVAFAIPLAAIVVIVSSVCGISTGVNKMVSTKMKKSQKKLEEVTERLRKVNVLYSKAIDDDEITVSEYEKILNT